METVARLLHCRNYSKQRNSFGSHIFTLRDKLRGQPNGLEKSVSLVNRGCAPNLCEHISSKEYLQRTTSKPYIFWNISIKQHQLQSELRDGKLIIKEDNNCHVLLSVVPEHNGDKDVFEGNKYYLENIFKNIFSMDNVVCCSEGNIEVPFNKDKCCIDEKNVKHSLDEGKIKNLLAKSLSN